MPRFNSFLAPVTPLVKMEYPGFAQSKTLIIFMPGIDDLAEDFERRGIIDELRSQGVTADAIAVDTHFGYYAEQVIFERMSDDVIAWAHVVGYESIWLAGISLGGFGAALYAAHHASHINGLILFAPYLGNDAIIQEIANAGGMKKWNPGEISERDYQRTLWTWFKNHLATDKPELPVYLGYGTGDKFARANTLLSEGLDPKHVFAIKGGHDWQTWKKLWRMFLEEWKRKL
ncbi:MAG: serine aminopeptidase domain-containing protein [Burkholderiaceae bacterium]